MKSPFEQVKKDEFDWRMIGDVNLGRKNLGDQMPVSVYRLYEYTMRAVLIKELGKEKTIDMLRKAGRLAGSEFTKHLLDTSLDLEDFIAMMQNTLADMKIGVLAIESFDEKTGKAVLTVSEDLDCSGLPMIGETVCNYDEGFIAGILSEYTKKEYIAIEIDCWAKGDRVCRFEATVK